jgi:hypothetical protein
VTAIALGSPALAAILAVCMIGYRTWPS